MPYTYPNQRKVLIHREPLNKGGFLGINNEHWMSASRDLGAHALRLYLYLASNKDGYSLALSPEAVRQAIGMPRSTYHDQFKILIEKGYLVPSHGNTYEFFELPCEPEIIMPETEILIPAATVQNAEISSTDGGQIPRNGSRILPEDIEINNKEISPDKRIDNTKTFQEKAIKTSPEEEKERWELFF